MSQEQPISGPRRPALPPEVAAVYPWPGHFLEVDGGAMHYLDEGPRDAPVMLALHGNPTWSFYWRALVARFAGRYRVIVPDHIGCGLSEKPQDWTYQLGDHVRNVQYLVEQLGLKDITLVVHDWGGAIGFGVAGERPELFRRFVVTNTAAFLSKDIPPSIALCKIPVFGALAVRGLNGFARAATVRAVEKPLSPAARAGLLFPYGSWADRIATLRFVADIPLYRAHPSYSKLSFIEDTLVEHLSKPMQLIWGMKDFCFTPKFLARWREFFPDARVEELADVGHYVMEDAPDRALNTIEAFLRETGDVP